SDVGAGDRLHKADLGRYRGAAHELDPPLDAFGGKPVAEATCHGPARPMLDAVPFEFLGQLGSALGRGLAHRRLRADDRSGEPPLGPARGEGPSNGAANLGADQVKTLD